MLFVHADAVDDVIALFELDEHRGNLFGLVLEIGIHHHDHLAADGIHPRGHGNVVAEIPRELQDADPRIGRVEVPQHGKGAVAAAVVDEDQLVGPSQFVQHGGEAAVQLANDAGLVVNGEDDGKVGAVATVRSPASSPAGVCVGVVEGSMHVILSRL